MAGTREPPAPPRAMEQKAQDAQTQKDAAALEALVRCLARIAAEEDYAAHNGALPLSAQEEN